MFFNRKSRKMGDGRREAGITTTERPIVFENYRRIVDDGDHIKPSPDTATNGNSIKMRGNWHSLRATYKYLKTYPEVIQFIHRSGWGELLDAQIPKTSWGLVQALGERWWDTTNTFQLPTGELTITPYDFTILTG